MNACLRTWQSNPTSNVVAIIFLEELKKLLPNGSGNLERVAISRNGLALLKKALFLEKCFNFSYQNAFLSEKADFEILEIDFGLSKFKFHEQTTTGDKKRRFGIGKYFCAVFVCDLTDLLNPKVLLKDRFI